MIKTEKKKLTMCFYKIHTQTKCLESSLDIHDIYSVKNLI